MRSRSPLLFFVVTIILGLSSQIEYNHDLGIELLRTSIAANCEQYAFRQRSCGELCEKLAEYTIVTQYTRRLTETSAFGFSIFQNERKHRTVVSFRGPELTKEVSQELLKSKPVEVLFPDSKSIKNGLAPELLFGPYAQTLSQPFMTKAKIEASKPLSRFHDWYFVGYGTGGPLAAWAAYEFSLLRTIPKEKIHLFTFDSPRVGNFAVAEAIVNNVGETFRVTSIKDVATHFPPCLPSLKGGCQPASKLPTGKFYPTHIWPEIFYMSNSYSMICTEVEDPDCSNMLMKTVPAQGKDTYLGIRTSCS